MIKQQLRKIYRAQRLALTDSERAKMDDLMLIQFQHSGIEIPDTVMTYAPLEKFAEFNPAFIEDYCLFKNPAVQFVYPVMKGHDLIPMLTDADTAFLKNSMDIDEPVDGHPLDPKTIDMIFVPMVIADVSGNRVGYGKGFYDRFLKQCRKDVVMIGFSYFEPVQEISDVFEGDVPLNYCITPNACYLF
ncbi:MAG: 5-formyltetrahydrofolate cyclo-ligase [Ferruginibacter sp.]|nr:5-formyltetrahydrofolate cyclo-ligase [Ferruginibacter sp.]